VRSPAPVQRTATVVRGLDEAAERMSRAENEEELARIVLEFASQHLRTCILFRVESDAARLWGAVGPDHGIDERLTGVTIPFEDGTIFGPIQSKHFYRGPVPDDPAFAEFYDRMGQRPPAEMLMAPVTGDGRTLAVIYGDGGPEESLTGAAGAMLRLVRRTALAFGMLRLKLKIRSG
jgi:hypothetical protein